MKDAPYNAHWAKNTGQKDINSEIGKIMKLLHGFQSPVMNQRFLLQILAIFS